LLKLKFWLWFSKKVFNLKSSIEGLFRPLIRFLVVEEIVFQVI
jgi:hypothetical protein